MKRIKAINGYTIYECNERDERNGDGLAGTYNLYFSSDVREYGREFSEVEWAADSLEEALAWANGSNYARAKEIVEESTTAAEVEEILAVEARLDAGEDPDEIADEADEIVAAYVEQDGGLFYVVAYNDNGEQIEHHGPYAAYQGALQGAKNYAANTGAYCLESCEIDGHIGTWHVVDQAAGLFLLEHDSHGDEAPGLIVDGAGRVVFDDAWNGFDDLAEIDPEFSDILEKLNNTNTEVLPMTKEEARAIIAENQKHDATAEISIFLNTWGNYNENGADGGAWINLPCDNLGEIMEALAEAMGDDDPEWFINDYSVDGDDLPSLNINEHSSISDLNDLAEKIAALDKWERETWAAAVEVFGGDINPDDIDNYRLYTDIQTDYDLGYYWIEESGCYDLSKLGHLANYFDFTAFGRDIRLESDGAFSSLGWVEKC